MAHIFAYCFTHSEGEAFGFLNLSLAFTPLYYSCCYILQEDCPGCVLLREEVEVLKMEVARIGQVSIINIAYNQLLQAACYHKYRLL